MRYKGSISLICYSLVLFSSIGFAQKKQKPNILWIMTDDQRMDSNAYYNKIVSGKNDSPLGFVTSPNLDALAEEGVVFTNFYCNSPACAPSRGSIITGKYPHHAGIYGFEKTHHQTDFFNKTLPQVMVENGYQSSIFGKTGFYIFNWRPNSIGGDAGLYQQSIDANQLRRCSKTTDWDNSVVWGKVNGKSQKIDSRVNFYYPDGTHKSYTRNADISKEEKKVKREVEKELDLLYAYTRSSLDMIIGGVNSMPADKTLDGNINREFFDYLRNENKNYESPLGKQMTGVDPSKPVFTSLSYHVPHTPVMPPKEFRDLFKGKTYKVPEFDKKELSKLPPQLKKLYSKMKIDGLKPDEKQQAIRDYYAFCAYGDYLIGKAVKEFKAYSKKHNQEYMIFYVCGDHGWQLGEQGIEAKFSPWELSNHTSAIIVASDKEKFPAGKVHKEFTEYVDIMPTILSAGGVDVNNEEFDYLDGYDLAEVLNDDGLKRDYVLGEFNHVIGPRAYIRTEEFSFSMRNRKSNQKAGTKVRPNEDVKWGLTADRDAVEMVLYDLRIDPAERNNVANDKKYKKLADWFRNKLGNIVLGDGRIESNWKEKNDYNRSDFAIGADDKKIDIPKKIIPKL